MLNRMKRVAAGLLTAVFLFNIAPVSGVNNVAQVEAAKLVTKGKVNSSILNIRTRKSTKAKKITETNQRKISCHTNSSFVRQEITFSEQQDSVMPVVL
jgi:hypothetical protein